MQSWRCCTHDLILPWYHLLLYNHSAHIYRLRTPRRYWGYGERTDLLIIFPIAALPVTISQIRMLKADRVQQLNKRVAEDRTTVYSILNGTWDVVQDAIRSTASLRVFRKSQYLFFLLSIVITCIKVGTIIPSMHYTYCSYTMWCFFPPGITFELSAFSTCANPGVLRTVFKKHTLVLTHYVRKEKQQYIKNNHLCF